MKTTMTFAYNSFFARRFTNLFALSGVCLLLSSAGCQSQQAATAEAAPTSAGEASAATALAAAPTPEATPLRLGESATTTGQGKADAPPTKPEPPPVSLKRLMRRGPLALPARSRQVVATQNPGVIIAYPVVVDGGKTGADADVSAACGLYLTLAIAGRSDLGRTPALHTVWRIDNGKQMRWELEQAREALERTGATHVALGTWRSQGDKPTLSYQWYVKRGTEVQATGTPEQVSGTVEQIASALPKLAQGLSRGASGAADASIIARAPDVPTLRTVGHYHNAPNAADLEPLKKLASASPLANFLVVSDLSVPTAIRKPLVQKLVQMCPDNQIVWSQLGLRAPYLLAPHRAALAQAQQRHPKSYALAQARTYLERVSSDLDAERTAAEIAVRNAPDNPDAFLSLGYTIGNSADTVRQGRTMGQMTPEMMGFVERIYPEWEATVKRATEIDPQHKIAWLRLSTASCFAGDAQTALTAYDKAVALDPSNAETLSWGLQMFQPKWLDDSARLSQTVDRIVKATQGTNGLNSGMVWSCDRVLKSLQMSEEREKLLSAALKAGEDRLAQNPRDTEGHYLRAVALAAQGKVMDAVDAYRKVTEIQPQNPTAFYDLGLYLGEVGRFREAAEAQRNAIRLAPDALNAYCQLSYALKHSGKLTEAEAALKQVLRLDPRNGDAYDLLGTVYATQNKADAAIAMYNKALSYSPHYTEAYNNLGVLYSQKKEYPKAAKAFETLLHYRPGDTKTLSWLTGIYCELKRWDEAGAACEAVLAEQPNNGVANENWGLVLNARGKRNEAREQWEKVLAIGTPEPAVAEAREMLAKYPAK